MRLVALAVGVLLLVGMGGYAGYCGHRAGRHRAPGVSSARLMANWERGNPANYTAEGRAWLQRGLRAQAGMILAFFVVVVLAAVTFG